MNDGNKRRSSAELIPLFFSAVLLDIIPIHYCHNLYSVMYSVKSVLHFPRSSLRRLRDEAAVNALLRHKFVVVAGLNDAPLVDNQDLIGVTNGIEPVGNDQQGLAPAQLGDGLLDVALIVGVHAGSGLIQNDDGSILQNAAGNGDSLPLSAR